MSGICAGNHNWIIVLQVDPNKEILLDVDSTSSDSDTTYLTPLTEMRKNELLDKEKEKAKLESASRQAESSKSRPKKKSRKSSKSKKSKSRKRRA